MIERLISKINSLIEINLGIKNKHPEIQGDKLKGCETYWEEQSRKIHDAYFGRTDRFFKVPVVQIHIASPDFSLGKYIVEKLKKSAVGIEFLGKISDSPLGGPIRIPQFPSISPTTATHIANLVYLEEVLNVDLSKSKRIVEFGGGYGGLSRCLKLINSTHQISIIDSQLMADIQRDYLKNTLPSNEEFDIEFRRKIAEINGGVDIFNASFSLSETPFEIRAEVLNFIKNNCKNFLIIFQKEFLEYDNLSYFNNWIPNLSATHKCNIETYSWYCGRSDAYAFSGKII